MKLTPQYNLGMVFRKVSDSWKSADYKRSFILYKSELVSTPDSSKVMSDFIFYDYTVEIGLTYYELRYALFGKKYRLCF